MTRGRIRNKRLSLRYKLALPVWIFVFVILLIQTDATIRLIRGFVVDAFRARIFSEAETFVESIRPDFLFRDFQALQSHLDWFVSRGDARGVQITDREGLPLLQSKPFPELADVSPLDRHAAGVEELSPSFYGVVMPLRIGTQELGRVQILYSSEGVERTVRRISERKILFLFLAAFVIALATAAWTWSMIGPLFRLRSTVRDILRGRTEARAEISTGDEIQDLAEAFNAMISALEQSLNNLRGRSEALEESEERYRAVVENASDVIWLLSPHGKILFINQGFSGLSRDALTKGGIELFLDRQSEDSARHFKKTLQKLVEEKIPEDHIASLYRDPENGNEIYYSSNLTPVFTGEGPVTAVQVVTRDVTELKRVEQMKDRLIRDVTHELKTPLAKFQMTLGWLEKELQKSGEEERCREVLGLIKQNADFLLRIITDVMDLSRFESGTMRPVRRSCDLNSILKRACDDLAPLAREKHLVLERKLSREPLPIEADEVMVYRLFSNLLANALKFTPEGKIGVSSDRTDKTCHGVVTDTGIGIEREDLAKIFDRFYQKSPAIPGLGLGLALAKEIAILHGGRIWAESEGLGKGATFVVEFPQ